MLEAGDNGHRLMKTVFGDRGPNSPLEIKFRCSRFVARPSASRFRAPPEAGFARSTVYVRGVFNSG